jgi:hypothetical protein
MPASSHCSAGASTQWRRPRSIGSSLSVHRQQLRAEQHRQRVQADGIQHRHHQPYFRMRGEQEHHRKQGDPAYMAAPAPAPSQKHQDAESPSG